MGLFVSCLTGLLSTFAVGMVLPNMNLKEAVLISLGMIAKDALLFLKDHPIPQDEPQTETKPVTS